jgi:hypothetical protein
MLKFCVYFTKYNQLVNLYGLVPGIQGNDDWIAALNNPDISEK